MAKLIIEKENGERVVVRDDLPENVPPRDILYRGDYIAMKLWMIDDVRSVLQEYGFEGTDEEIDEVLNMRDIYYLNDCTDDDWFCIGAAIEEAERRGLIRMVEDEIDDETDRREAETESALFA